MINMVNNDSIKSLLFCQADIKDPRNLALKIRDGNDKFSKYFKTRLSDTILQQLNEYDGNWNLEKPLYIGLINALNKLILGPCIFKEEWFTQIRLPDEIRRQICSKPEGKDLIELNRTLIEIIYSHEIVHLKSNLEKNSYIKSGNNLFEPTLLITFITSCLFLFGYGFYRSFLNTLFIPIDIIDISASNYIIKGFEFLIFSIPIFLITFIIKLPKSVDIITFEKHKIHLSLLGMTLFISSIVLYYILVIRLQIYSMFFITALLLIFCLFIVTTLFFRWIKLKKIYKNVVESIEMIFILVSITYILFLDFYTKIFILMILMVISFGIYSLFRYPIERRVKNFHSFYSDQDWTSKTIFGIVIISFIFTFSVVSGGFYGEFFISGIGNDAFEIHFSFIDDNNTEFQNSSFILVMFLDDKYYVIEKGEYLPEKPKTHIISANQVKTVTIDKKGRSFFSEMSYLLEQNLRSS